MHWPPPDSSAALDISAQPGTRPDECWHETSHPRPGTAQCGFPGISHCPPAAVAQEITPHATGAGKYTEHLDGYRGQTTGRQNSARSPALLAAAAHTAMIRPNKRPSQTYQYQQLHCATSHGASARGELKIAGLFHQTKSKVS